MDYPLIVLCFWILLGVKLEGYGSLGCWEEERIGLLKLRDFIVKNNTNSNGISDNLSSWVGKESGDCCRWDGIKCDNSTNRVIQLFLNGTMNRFSWDGVFNTSSLLPFHELQTLRLDGLCVRGLHGEFRLAKLQVLDLSFNCFTEFPSLGALRSLKFLNLEFNNINTFNLFEDLTSLSNLELLNLGYNNIAGDLPTSIGALTSLKALSFRRNGLNGSIPLEGLCKLRNLQELDLSRNSFRGNIPSCFSNFTSLRLLELSENNLQGTIPSTLFRGLLSLEYVSLSHNRFEGTFLFSSLANKSRLEVFELVSDNANLKVDTEYPTWTPLFQLKIFRLSNCTLNEPTFAIPTFLSSQWDLRVIDLGHNNMIGEVPVWLIVNNSKLEFLSLANNSLTGSIELQSGSSNLDMFWFDVSINLLQGELPFFIGSVLPNLLFLNMSSNALRGEIPPSIGDMRDLYLLDFSSNSFSGQIPEDLATGCVSLTYLKLSYNNLQGQILSTNSNLTELRSLYLDHNHFSGEMSIGLLNSSYLQILDLRNNSISGEIPNWIRKLSMLTSLSLSENLLEGSLPMAFCELERVRFLDLSWNNFTEIPPCLNPTSMRYLHLQGNEFRGPMPEVLSKASSSLVTLDLRDNGFSGNIPNWIGSFSNLRILLLSRNNFVNSIPLQLCQLNNISIIDLSYNSLSGSVPSCLSNIPFGRLRELDDTFETISSGWTQYRSLKTYSHQNQLNIYQYTVDDYFSLDLEEEVQFLTKSRYESYEGNILYFMSGLDLSGNELSGQIPSEIGNLKGIHTLNLSHNHLTGLIPDSFSNLEQIESLDLSYNELTGEIPWQLIELNFLSVFTVAYNNLSGKTPERKGQFATFDKSSYEGNAHLCGVPLEMNCSNSIDPPLALMPSRTSWDDDTFKTAFLWSFSASFAVAFLGVVAFLHINS